MFYSVLVLSMVALRTSEEFAGCTKGTFLMCSSGDNGAIEPTTLNKAMDDNQATWKCEKNIFNPEDDEFVSVNIRKKRSIYVSLFGLSACIAMQMEPWCLNRWDHRRRLCLACVSLKYIYKWIIFFWFFFFSISFLRGYRTISAIWRRTSGLSACARHHVYTRHRSQALF